MEMLPYSYEELSSLSKLHIYEQNINVILNPKFSIFQSMGDMHVIIGYEADHTFLNNDSKLVCGIVKLRRVFLDGQDVYLEKLVLPFSSKVLFARLEERQVAVIFRGTYGIQKFIMSMEDENILPQDYSIVMDEDYPVVEPLGKYHEALKMEEKILRK